MGVGLDTSSPSRDGFCADCCAVIVTYNPEPEHLRQQLAALESQCEIIIVDNGTPGTVQSLVDEHGSRAHLLSMDGNVGIARAQNKGLEHAIDNLPQCTYFVLLDHDSLPPPGFVAAMRGQYLEISEGRRISIIGPSLYDPRSEEFHGFHVLRGLVYKRISPAEVEEDAVETIGVNSSGSFGALDVYRQVGAFDEGFFIDQVETEWCLRATAAGLPIFGVPGVEMTHYMGDDVLAVRLPGKTYYFPYRSPLRHRYLFRNSVTLLKRGYVPLLWKFYCAVKLVFSFLLFLVFSSERWAQTSNMLRGLWDGIRGRSGPIA